VAAQSDTILVAWASSVTHQLTGWYVDGYGNVTPDGGFALAPSDRDQASIALATDGQRSVAVWKEPDDAGTYRVHAALSDGADTWNAVSAAFEASPTGTAQDDPRVLFDGTNYVVVWTEPGAATPALLAARVDVDGGTVDATPTTVPLDSSYSSLDLEEIAPGQMLVMTSHINSPQHYEHIVGRYLSEGGCSQDSDCGALDVCHAAGACVPFASVCWWPAGADNTPCPHGACFQALCVSPDSGIWGWENVDAGDKDGGAADAGEGDAGAFDGGVVDAGVADAGVEDAGLPDSGTIDGGPTVADAGASAADGGDDAGTSTADGGAGTGHTGACGCATGPAFTIELAALLLLLRRRPRISPR
jgi:hypothetical protein